MLSDREPHDAVVEGTPRVRCPGKRRRKHRFPHTAHPLKCGGLLGQGDYRWAGHVGQNRFRKPRHVLTTGQEVGWQRGHRRAKRPQGRHRLSQYAKQLIEGFVVKPVLPKIDGMELGEVWGNKVIVPPTQHRHHAFREKQSMFPFPANVI